MFFKHVRIYVCVAVSVPDKVQVEIYATYALQTGPDARLHRLRKCLVLPHHMPRETLSLAQAQTMWPTTMLAGHSMCVNSRTRISLPM